MNDDDVVYEITERFHKLFCEESEIAMKEMKEGKYEVAQYHYGRAKGLHEARNILLEYVICV